MVKRISAQEAQAHLLDVLQIVSSTNETVVVESEGTPLAIVLSPEEYESLRDLRAWAAVDRVRERNSAKSEEEVIADVDAEVEAVRREMHERTQENSHGSH